MITEGRPNKPPRPLLIEGSIGSDDVVRPRAFPDGNLALTGEHRSGRFGRVAEVRYVPAGEGTYRAHFVSCPDRDKHRRPRR
jgi:hypothetical protein